MNFMRLRDFSFSLHFSLQPFEGQIIKTDRLNYLEFVYLHGGKACNCLTDSSIGSGKWNLFVSSSKMSTQKFTRDKTNKCSSVYV